MDRFVGLAIVLAILVVIFVGLGFGWRARHRRQRDFPPLATPPSDPGAVLLTDDVLYVATTRADLPLDRITVRGLAFRGRAGIRVTESGVLLDLAGRPTAFIPRTDLRGAGRATWTIDRVVDHDGLVFIRWALGGIAIDSYLRSVEPAAIVAAIDDLTPPTIEEPLP